MDNTQSRFGVVVPAPQKSPAQRKADERAMAQAKADRRKAMASRPLAQNLGGMLKDALKGKKLRSA